MFSAPLSHVVNGDAPIKGSQRAEGVSAWRPPGNRHSGREEHGEYSVCVDEIRHDILSVITFHMPSLVNQNASFVGRDANETWNHVI